MRCLFFSSLILFVAGGCASNATKPTQTFEFTIDGMTCEMCPPQVIKAVEKVPGVSTIEVDLASKTGRVRADQRVTTETIRKAISQAGFDAHFQGDSKDTVTTAELAKADVKEISNGNAIQIEKEIVAGKITIFDYWAEWCGPCKVLAPKLEALSARSKNVALRKVDIVNWQSPVAKQATEEFKIPGLPYVRVYDTDGKFLGAVEGNHLDQIEALLKGKIQK